MLQTYGGITDLTISRRVTLDVALTITGAASNVTYTIERKNSSVGCCTHDWKIELIEHRYRYPSPNYNLYIYINSSDLYAERHFVYILIPIAIPHFTPNR